ELQVVLLAGLQLFLRFGEGPGQGHGHHDHSTIADRSAPKDVLRSIPAQALRVVGADGSQRNARLQRKPGCGESEAGFVVSVFNGNSKTTLQRRLVRAKLVQRSGKAVTLKSALDFRRGSNGHGL